MTPYQHLRLLLRQERALALRAIIRESVGPGMRVLDAGCGVGLLAMWAIQAGADRALAVDVDDTTLARRLAAENAVASRIDFMEADLGSLDLPSERNSFDAILAMVYLNDPRRDDAQARLVFGLRQKYLAPGGTMVPNRVRYRARACEWPAQDHHTRQARLRADITELQGRYNLTFQALYDAVSARSWIPQFPERRSDGRLDVDDARLLSSPQLFAEVDYTRDYAPYPTCLEIQTDVPGIFNTIVWTQELWFDDRLIFSNESLSWVSDPRMVRAGSTYIIRLDSAWKEQNVVTLVKADDGTSRT